MFLAPFAAFQYLHLQHHRHTNDPSKDPDNWSGNGPVWLLPCKWLTQNFHYYYLYLPLLMKRPRQEASSTIIQLGSIIAIVTWGLRSDDYYLTFMYTILLPGLLAIFPLAYAFDYLPHRPHIVTREENVFKATSVTSLVGEHTWLLTWLLLYQNYHNIHHLYPHIPFYQYSQVWERKKNELIVAGTEYRPIFK